MTNWKQQRAALRITTLTAALMGIYGVPAFAVPGPPFTCEPDCSFEEATYSHQDFGNTYTWAFQVTGENATLNMDGTSVVALGNKNRGVGAASGGTAILNGVTVTTRTVDVDEGDNETFKNSYWGNHGVQAFGSGSRVEISDSRIETDGTYSNGIQAESSGTVLAKNVEIDVDGGSSHTFGVEAGNGGHIFVEGNSSINVAGNGAAGARAYAGIESTIVLDGTAITAEGNAIGLMAGDKDGDTGPETAGTINLRNGSVVAESSPAALVRYGSFLQVVDSKLESGGHTLDVEGEGSIADISGKSTVIKSTGKGGGNGSLVSVVHADDRASIHITDGAVQATGDQYTRGLLATSGGKISTEGTAVSTTGNNSHAVQAFGKHGTGEGAVRSEVTLTGGTVTTSGDESSGIYAQEQGRVSANGVTITTHGENAGFGAFAWKEGELRITGGSITTNGASSFEHDTLKVDVGNYGVLVKNKSTAIVDGTTITTKGEDAQGLRAENDGADGNVRDTSSTITATNVTVNTSGREAHGVTAYGSATKSGEWAPGSTVSFTQGTIRTTGQEAAGALAINGGLVMLTTTNITTTGVKAHGVGASSIDETLGDYGPSLAILNNVNVRTEGKDAFGLAVFNGDSEIQVTGGSITTAGEGGAGVFLGNGADVTLTGTRVESKGPTFLSYFGPEDVEVLASDLEQTIEARNSVLETNNGVLMRIDRSTGGEQGEVLLELRGNTRAVGNIENYRADGSLDTRENVLKYTKVEKDESASWLGIMVDASTKIAKSGETVTGNQGDVTAGDNSNVSFQNVPQISGSVSVTPGSQFSFSGGPTTITGNLMGMGGSGATFNNDVSVGGNVQTSGGNIAFNGNTNIAGGVQGTDGGHIHFSMTGSQTTLGSASFNSGATVGGGTINAPIIVSGNVNIDNSLMFGGNWSIQGNLASYGSILTPGNSIGTITTNTISPLAGNTINAEVDAAGQADLLVVQNGNVDLTGAHLVVDQYGGYRLNHDYTIIRTEAGTVVGEFETEKLGDTFAGTLVKLDPTKYGEKDVKVSLSADHSAIDRTGYSSNQSATLDGVLSVAGQNAAADAVMLMQPDARKDALNQLSGELHGSTQAALLQNSSLVTRTLTQRMRGNLGAGMLPGAPTAQAGGTVAGAMPTSAAYPLWAQVVGNWSTLDDDGNAAKVKTNVAGLFIGGDAEVGAGWRVGGALGYTDGRVKVDDRNSKSDVSSFTAALYGGNSWDQGNGKLNFLVGAAYSHHDIDSRRQVNVGGNQTLKADYSAHSTQVFSELGYAMPVGQRSTVEPYVGVAWLNQKAKGFTEEGGPAALQGESQKDSITTFTLGLRGKTALDVGRHTAHIFAGLGWRHASGDVDPGRRVSFVQGGGTTFGVAGAPIAKNAAVVDLGVEMSVGRNTAMGLGYSGQFGDDNTDHSGQLFLRTRF